MYSEVMLYSFLPTALLAQGEQTSSLCEVSVWFEGQPKPLHGSGDDEDLYQHEAQQRCRTPVTKEHASLAVLPSDLAGTDELISGFPIKRDRMLHSHLLL